MKSFFSGLFLLLSINVTPFSLQANHHEEEEDQKGYTFNKDWLYVGTMQLNKFLTLEDVAFGFRHQDTFYKDQYKTAHSFDVKILKAPKQYYANSDQAIQKIDYNFKMYTGMLADGLTVHSSVGFNRHRWGKNKGINYGTRIDPIGLEYGFFMSGMFREISFGYAPMYEYFKYNVVTSADTLIEEKSAEYFHHKFLVRMAFKFCPKMGLINQLTYTIGSDLKTGDSSTDYNELNNDLSLFYYVGQSFDVFYKNNIVVQKRRNTLLGLDNSYNEHSFNLAYSF